MLMSNIKRKLGRFSITRDMIDTSPDMVAGAMSGMLVVRAELQYHSDAIAYIAMSDFFDFVPLHGQVPEYEANVRASKIKDGDDIKIVSTIEGWSKL